MPATITADELAGMVETSEENLPDVCNVITIDFDRGPLGEVEEVAITGPDFPCRIRPLSQSGRPGTEALVLQRLGVIEAWKVKAPKEVQLSEKDRLLVDVDGIGTRELEVIASPGLKSRQLVDSYYCVEIK